MTIHFRPGTFFPLLLLSIGLIALAAGCRAVPFSDRSQLMLTGSDYENELGRDAYAEYLKKYPKSTRSDYNAALARVGAAIRQVAGQDDFAWEFNVLESSEANAFCLPGGKVAVYSGIFPYMANEAELACVVSHEIAHAIARHSGERMSWAQLQSLGAIGVNAALKSETANSIYGVGSELGVMLPFSRANETEADLIGLRLMARAGYRPDAAVAFWRKFGGGQPSSRLAVWLSTHPGGDERIADLQKNLPAAEAEYRQAKVRREYGQTLSR